MATYRIDKETRELIPKDEWIRKYGDEPRGKGPMIIVKGKWDAYESPITGEIITSARQRENEMKEHDCVDYEPSLRGEADRKVREEEAKLERKIDETVDHEISTMPAVKREKLFEELKSGVDIEVERL